MRLKKPIALLPKRKSRYSSRELRKGAKLCLRAEEGLRPSKESTALMEILINSLYQQLRHRLAAFRILRKSLLPLSRKPRDLS